MRATVELKHASRLLNHGPTVLVSVARQGVRNLMAAAWSMPVEFDPPRIAVVIDKSTYTRELVVEGGMLALNLPCRAQADLVFTVGSVSGRDEKVRAGGDKFSCYGIEAFEGPVLGQPLVAGCVAWMEGRVMTESHSQQAYDTFFVEIVSAQADDRIFRAGRWRMDGAHPQLHTLHHLSGGLFAVPMAAVSAKVLPPVA
jgi:flavin reductase (DIM6/NTAB) family NADH-FMN oxidoreductase RutF